MSASSSTSVPAARPNPSSPSSSRKAAKASASASAPSSRSTHRAPADPYYGHEETAVLCASFITSLFNCPHIPTATHAGAPTPTLAHFVAYALHRTRLPSVVTFAALLLLQRLKTRFPGARGSSGHRLFISAFMIASKVICDDTYSNQSWCIVGQKMFALTEINQMEREMCVYLQWNLNVSGEEVADFEARVHAEYGPAASVPRARAHATELPAYTYPSTAAAAAYPSPETTPSSTGSARPIRPVPAVYSKRTPVTAAFPSPNSVRSAHLQPHHVSPQPPALASASSSLASSPASEDCKTPSPVAVAAQPHPHGSQRSASSRSAHGKHHVDMEYGFNQRLSSGQPLAVGGW